MGDSDSGQGTPKKKKTAQQCWKSSYSEENPEIVKSTKGDQYAFCKACESHFSVAHGGGHDVSRHVTGAKHKLNKKGWTGQPAITGFVKKHDDNDTDMVTRAEAMMCSLIVQHNLPFSTADSLQSAVQEMFPDSKIAKGKHDPLSVSVSLSCFAFVKRCSGLVRITVYFLCIPAFDLQKESYFGKSCIGV